MKMCVRFLAILTTAGCVLSACGPADGDGSGTGGSSASGGQNGSGGSGSGGATGSGGHGSGGSASGGSGSGGSGSGGSASGGSGAGGSGSGGSASGGATGSGGNAGTAPGGATGSGGQTGGRNGSAGAMGGRGAGGRGGPGGSTTGSGGSNNGGSSGTFSPCPTSDPCKVLPLGDSITFGIQYEGAYRVELFSKAVGAGQKITYVGGAPPNGPTTVANMPFPRMHEGHSGFTIDQMKPYIMSNMAAKPNIILLHIGTNDAYMSNPGGAPDRLKALVDMILTGYPDSLLVVAKIVPYPSQMANIDTINNSIPGLVQDRAAMGKHILMADLNTGFKVSTMLSSDSIHPNKTGYDFMGDTFYAVISSYLH